MSKTLILPLVLLVSPYSVTLTSTGRAMDDGKSAATVDDEVDGHTAANEDRRELS